MPSIPPTWSCIEAEQFENCQIFTPKLKIMSFDIESSIKYGNIYCICFTV